MIRRAGLATACVLLVAVAGAGLWQGSRPEPPSALQRGEVIAAGLRCPTCQGLSVADSPSKVAASMRDIIAEQIDSGRSDAEIRQWFVGRYGQWILLSPRAGGLGWAAWLLPVVALGGGVLVAGRRLRGHRPRIGDVDPGGAEAAARAAADGALALPLGAAGERVETSLALLDAVRADRAAGVAGQRAEHLALRHLATALAGVRRQPEAPTSAPQPQGARSAVRWIAVTATFGVVLAGLLVASVSSREAGELPTGTFAERPQEPARQSPSLDDELAELKADVAADPDDARTRLLLGAALLQRGAAGEAQVEAQAVLAVRPDDADALLILGLTQTALDDPAATATLRRFLDVAPTEHPGRDIAEPLLAP